MIQHVIQNNQFLNIVSTEMPNGTIVYIHGLGESGLCFRDLIKDKRLADWNHIVPELSGYGRSAWPRQEADLEYHAEMIAEIAKKSVSRPLIILGHSMGGVIGQIVCEKYPDLVNGFFNVEGNISIQDCTFSSRAAKYTKEKFIRSGFEELKNSVYLAGVRKRAFRSYYASLMLAHPATYHKNSLELVQLSKLEVLAQRLSSLKIPRKYLAGLEGGAGVRSLELLRQVRMDRALLEDAGHWPFIDQPNVFIEELLKFTLEVGYS